MPVDKIDRYTSLSFSSLQPSSQTAYAMKHHDLQQKQVVKYYLIHYY